MTLTQQSLKLAEQLAKYVSDPEYRFECIKEAKQEEAFYKLRNLLLALQGYDDINYNIDMTAYKNMSAEELELEHNRILKEANDRAPKCSLEYWRKLLSY